MEIEIATLLLDASAVTLRPSQPFTYTSGIKSPIYCDNRSLIGSPIHRTTVTNAMVATITSLEFDVVAGTATAGISWAAWIADELDKPMAYIRSSSKGYGKEKLIEGADVKNKRVLIVEDLISTGGSSISAVQGVREAGGTVTDCIAIFTYGLEKSKAAFSETDCTLHTLTNLTELTTVAEEKGIITTDEKKLVLNWQKDPEHWGV